MSTTGNPQPIGGHPINQDFSSTKTVRGFLDSLSCGWLAIAAVLLTFGCAYIYWQLPYVFGSGNGLVGSEVAGKNDKPANGAVTASSREPIGYPESLYFSIITETTLGYGDIRPEGWSRGLACTQVCLGVLLAGISVAKIASLPGRELRDLSKKACGNWIELKTLPKDEKDVPKNVLAFVKISFDGATIRYSGRNFERDGTPHGAFTCVMLESEDATLRFRYTNHHSFPGFLEEGMVDLIFSLGPKGKRWNKYEGGAYDYFIPHEVGILGKRADDKQVKIIFGANREAQLGLIREQFGLMSQDHAAAAG